MNDLFIMLFSYQETVQFYKKDLCQRVIFDNIGKCPNNTLWCQLGWGLMSIGVNIIIGYVYNNVVFLGCYLRVHPHYRWESPPSSGCQWPQQTKAWRVAESWTQTEHPPPDCMTFGWPLRRWGTPTGTVTPYPDTVWSGYQREAC